MSCRRRARVLAPILESAVAGEAYRSGEFLTDEGTGEQHDYRHSETLARVVACTVTTRRARFADGAGGVASPGSAGRR